MTRRAQEQAGARVVSPRGLRLLLASTAFAVAGQGIMITAGPLLAASLTRRPFEVSLAAAAAPAAGVGAGLPGGAFVGRLSRRRVMFVTDALRAGLLVLLVVAIASNVASIGLLVAILFLVGVGSCFFDPASQAAIPGLVGRDERLLQQANGKLWAIDTFGRGLIGPPLGALLFGLAVSVPFGVEAGAFAISAVLLA